MPQLRIVHTLVKQDIISTMKYLITVYCGDEPVDDIDHLSNRRVRSVGELLQNQFRIGITRLERVVRERMAIQDLDVVTPQSLIKEILLRPDAARAGGKV